MLDLVLSVELGFCWGFGMGLGLGLTLGLGKDWVGAWGCGLIGVGLGPLLGSRSQLELSGKRGRVWGGLSYYCWPRALGWFWVEIGSGSGFGVGFQVEFGGEIGMELGLG